MYMNENKRGSGRLAYYWFWIWLLIVLSFSIVLYSQIFTILGSVLAAISLTEGLAEIPQDSWIYLGMIVLGGILFSWRVVKVVVLHAAPISFGWVVGDGIHKENGRRGTFVSIEGTQRVSGDDDNSSMFWCGIVLRAHPASDKLVRSRLEFLVLALPFDRSLLIMESRWMLQEIGHVQRQVFFNQRMAEYLKSTEFMPTDKFRRELVASIDSMQKDLSSRLNRIDGLKWLNYSGGEGGAIIDDFGYEVTYRKDENRYVVDTTAEGDQVLAFENITELREYAKSVLNPT